MTKPPAHTNVRSILRAQISFPVVYKIFNVCFAVVFIVTAFFSIFGDAGAPGYEWYWLACAAAVGMLVFFLFSFLFSLVPPPAGVTEWVLVPLLLVVFFAAQLVVGNMLRIQPDPAAGFGEVFSYAKEYVVNGVRPTDYFLQHPGDTGLYLLWCGYFQLLHWIGISDFLMPAMVLNALMMTLSVSLLYLCARRLFGSGKALFAIMMSFFVLPFMLYASVPVADTLAMPFPIAAVLLWLSGRRHWREGSMRGAAGCFLLISALMAIGTLLRSSVVIVWVAVAIDLLVLLCGKGRVRLFLVGAVVFLLLFLGGTYMWRVLPMLPNYDYEKTVPFASKTMMGLKGNGAYNEQDFEQIVALPNPAARAEYVRDEIASRATNLGAGGTAMHLLMKLGYTFGDGTLDVDGQLGSIQQQNGISEFVRSDGGVMNYAVYVSFAVQIAFLFWMVVGALCAVKRRNYALTFVRVSLFGLVLSLLIWDTSPRYLLCFLPLFMLGALEAARMPSRTSKRRQTTPTEPPETLAQSAVSTREFLEKTQQVNLQPLKSEPEEAENKPSLPKNLFEPENEEPLTDYPSDWT